MKGENKNMDNSRYLKLLEKNNKKEVKIKENSDDSANCGYMKNVFKNNKYRYSYARILNDFRKNK